MSYGVRYRCEWTSPMREKREYQIEILQRDYVGEVDTLYPTGDVVVITQGKLDADELDAIKSSEATLSLLCVEDGDPYMSLFTTDPLLYKLSIRRRVRELSKERLVPEWEGYLSAGTYSQEYSKPPYHVSLKAVDGLAILKDIPYLNEEGARFSDNMTIGEMIAYIMSKISSMEVTYPWPLCVVEPGCDANTQDVVALNQTTVYSSFDDDKTPSCYEVLDAVLRSLQLQLFQSYGKWVVRPIAELITSRRPQRDSLVNKGEQVMSLWDDSNSGKGVSVAATLSLLAPYKSVEIKRPGFGEVEKSARSMLKSSRWKKVWATATASFYSRTDMLRLATYQPSRRNSKHLYGLAYYFDDVVAKADAMSMNIDITAYNLSNTGKSVYAGVFAVDSTTVKAYGDWLFTTKGDEIVVNDNVVGWSNESSSWVAIDSGDVPFEDLAQYFREIKLEASRRYIHFEHPAKVSQMTASNISLSADIMPSVADYMRIILILVGPVGEVLPEIEIREPSITFSHNVQIVDDVYPENVEVAKNGLESISFDQHFADSWVTPTPGRALTAPLIHISNGSEIKGIVTPMRRSLLADSVTSAMRMLRGRIARQIEGELYIDTAIDLDAVFQDRELRLYYTNYIRRHLRRGVYTVQLREIPAMDKSAQPHASYARDLASPVGLDTSAYFLSIGRRNIVRYDVGTDTFILLASSPNGTYELTLNAGQMSASVVSFDGAIYSLTAYDTYGNILSRIDNLNALTNVSLSSGLLDGFARSAKYDANIHTWVLIGGDATTTYLQMISRDGEDFGLTIYTVGNYRNVTDSCLIPNGFACTTTSSSGHIYGWWHSHSQHSDATLAVFAENKRIIACNEIYVVIEDRTRGKNSLHRRTDTNIGYDPRALYEVDISRGRWVDMNNALVLFRTLNSDGSDGYGATLYDGRTGRLVSLTTPFAIGSTYLWLSGSSVYGAYVNGAGGYGVIRQQIMIGDGDGYVEYITSDGYRYVTDDNKIYLAIK